MKTHLAGIAMACHIPAACGCDGRPANIRRFDPGHIKAVGIIAEMPMAPGVRFITSGDASDDRLLLQ
ncbi:hypothetical protein [Rhizobium leguminosarum]|uniref:hypothetical protein n=1 Tax=Rhizobium leguminosarum TaxID=384 RepID=UPI0032AEDEA1